MLRSVILFPAFAGLDIIQSLREKHDPLAHCIRPHITIVFPFESNLTTPEIQRHLKDQLSGIPPFQIRLAEITGNCRDGYLFLNVKQGNDQIIELHDRLYSGILKKYHYRKMPYSPHLTIGRVKEPEEFDRVLGELKDFDASFATVIDQVCVECIGANEKSIVEIGHPLAVGFNIGLS